MEPEKLLSPEDAVPVVTKLMHRARGDADVCESTVFQNPFLKVLCKVGMWRAYLHVGSPG